MKGPGIIGDKTTPCPSTETGHNPLLPAETEQRLHALQVRQIKLEMQNEELRRYQEECEASKQRYFGLFDLAPVGYLIISDKGLILEANFTATSMLGMARGALVKQPISRIIPEDHQDTYYLHCKQLFDTGEPLTFELQMLKMDGTEFLANLLFKPAYNGEYWLIIEDISRRRLFEETQSMMSRAVEQCPVSIVITNILGTIVFVNPKFIELSGYTAEEAIGQNPRILKSGKTPPETYEKLWSTISSGDTWEGDVLNKSKDGGLFWEHSRVTALRNDSGAITHYIAVKEDITEKKNILEQLTVAKKQADTASQAKSNFLATMSHEIRTPMNGVIGMTGLLLETKLTDEQYEYAEIVRKSGENLLSLINDILDFSKIEAGKLDLEVLDFDLRVTLEDTAELLAVRAADAGLELIIRVDPAVPSYLRGDPGRLRQIISNLVGNAIKFTHRGEIVISAALQSQMDDLVTIHFGILDTGIGIPESRLAAIFEPFTQLDGSTTRKYGGTGLGLAICRQLTELMGGEIGVFSEVGRGSTFWFTARFQKQTSQVSRSSDSSAHANISGVRILVVDDNATNRILMTTFLNNWGCRYESAADGETGFAMLHEAAEKQDPFRIALLDHEMPGMDGLEFGRRIKADPLLSSILMVMVTSLGQRGDAAVLEQIGFVGYLVKPVRHSQLRECLELALGRADQASEARGIITRHIVAENAKHGMRILLAEDNVINQKVAQHMLKTLGYRVDVVANGWEAVRALEMINYDLVLMDCMMPDMDGFEATAVIRDTGSKVSNHDVPIIAMTANAMKGDRDRCIEAGMDDYLAKPVKKEELKSAIERWFTINVYKEGLQQEEFDKTGAPPLFDAAGIHRI
ncbi:MAG: response regulator [Desulfuromonadales bacterium]